MQTSGAASLASSLSALDAVQVPANYQTSIQRDVLDVQQSIIAQLFASLGVGTNLDVAG